MVFLLSIRTARALPIIMTESVSRTTKKLEAHVLLPDHSRIVTPNDPSISCSHERQMTLDVRTFLPVLAGFDWHCQSLLSQRINTRIVCWIELAGVVYQAHWSRLQMIRSSLQSNRFLSACETVIGYDTLSIKSSI